MFCCNAKQFYVIDNLEHFDKLVHFILISPVVVQLFCETMQPDQFETCISKLNHAVRQHIEVPITKVAQTDVCGVDANAESYSNLTGFPPGVPISTWIHFVISRSKALGCFYVEIVARKPKYVELLEFVLCSFMFLLAFARDFVLL